MNKSRIEWTDVTWNPVTGCTPISPGCENCYARRMATRLRGRCGYPEDEAFKVMLRPERLMEPLLWKKPKRVFVCSMGDLFHDDVDDGFLCRVFDAILAAEQHIFLVLTKRPKRMMNFFKKCIHGTLSNLWVGVTVENQEVANKRIPLLLQTPAAVHFISCEPLLGPVDLRPWIKRYYHGGVPGLRVGDTLLPPSITGKSTLLEYAKKVDPNGPQRADKRDAFRCQYCGRSAPDVVLEVDHIKPIAKGGIDTLDNLITACEECNLGKGARLLDDHSVLEKQRRQLEELNKRREQLEMMMQWRDGNFYTHQSIEKAFNYIDSRCLPRKPKRVGTFCTKLDSMAQRHGRFSKLTGLKVKVKYGAQGVYNRGYEH